MDIIILMEQDCNAKGTTTWYYAMLTAEAEELVYLEWTLWAATWTVKGEGSSKCGVFWWRYSRGVPGIHLIISCKSLSWVATTYLKNKYAIKTGWTGAKFTC